MSTRVIVGLGNPGAKYAYNRHNLGFMVVMALADRWGVPFKDETRFSSRVAKGRCGDDVVYLVMPMTYMNESGVAARKVMDYYKLDTADVMVVVDDVDTPFAELRIRENGGAGGHNGLRSIEQHLGTREYLRLKMGIGAVSAQPGERDMVSHVLGDFSGEERKQLAAFVRNGADTVERLCRDEVGDVMNDVNRRVKKKEQQSHPVGQEKKNDDKDEKAAV